LLLYYYYYTGDLERLKKAKVYSHAQLRIQCSNGSYISCKCLPTERVSTVVSLIANCCLVTTPTSVSALELYVTPPRRRLQPHKTLLDEGLVPAAKIFVSSSNDELTIRPELFVHHHDATTTTTTMSSSFPQATPLVQDEAKKKQDNTSSNTTAATKKPSKEEMLMRRMMGGKAPMRGGGGGGKRKDDDDDEKGSKGAPKWFKR